MQCPSCGNTIENNNANFCPACGSPITAPQSAPKPDVQEEQAAPAAQQPAPQTPPVTQNPASQTPAVAAAPPSKSNKGKLVKFVLFAAVVLFIIFMISQIGSCISGAVQSIGGGSGSVTALTTDTRSAEAAVSDLLNAAKKSDSKTVSKLYLGDEEDFIVSVGAPVLVTKQGFYYDAFLTGFDCFVPFNSKSTKVQEKMNSKLHSFNYQIVSTMPLGNMLDRDLEGARVRVKVDGTYVRWAEEYAEYDMANLLVEKLGDKGQELFRKALLGEYRGFTAADWAKEAASEAKEWIEDSVDYYYSSLDSRLDEAPTTFETEGGYVDFIVVKDGKDWKVAPMGEADLYYLWGGCTAKFGKDTGKKDVRYSAAGDYFPEVTTISETKMKEISYDGGKLAESKDADVHDASDIKTTAKFGKDGQGRWVIVGEVQNKAKDTKNIVLFPAVYGTDSIGNRLEASAFVSDPVSNGTDMDISSGCITMKNMKAGERRQFVLYPRYRSGSMAQPAIIDITQIDIASSAIDNEKIVGMANDIEVVIDSVYYDLKGANTISPSVVITGKMTNNSKETVYAPVPIFVLTKDGVPLPALDKEQENIFGAALTSTKADGRTKAPASLGPGEQGEFTVHCELNESNANGIFLHGVSVGG